MSVTIHTSRQMGPTDRFSITLGAAVVLHAIILLGFSFEAELRLKDKMPEAPRLDVTMVNTTSTVRPKAPDYLAQADQEGGGNTQEKVRPQSPPEAAPDVLPSPGNAMQTHIPTEKATPPQPDEESVLTINRSKTKVSVADKQPEARTPLPSAAELARKSLDLARLDAELSDALRVYTKKPREKLLVPNTMTHVEAAYLDRWQKKVEVVGNMNYPEKAKATNISGDLLLMVSINRDGSINDIQLLRSSGHPTLDDAARRIVKLAAPYPPLPEDILRETDILKIPRVWKFTSGNTLVTTASGKN